MSILEKRNESKMCIETPKIKRKESMLETGYRSEIAS